MMIEFRKLINEGLAEHTGLMIYLPQQEMSGLTESDFPLITLDMEFQDGVRTYNQEVVTQKVYIEVYLYASDIEEVVLNGSIVQYFSKTGLTKVRESQVGRTHHWYKSYQFKADVQKDEQGNYVIS